MYHYLFTNDLRISHLEESLIEAGKCFVEDRVPSATEDKNANNNMNTLGFYFNLTKESNCAKYCANRNIRPVILNFIKKFQFPNPRTTESLNDSINDNISLAPLRIIIQVLYFMNNINKDQAYLSDTEIASYIFFNDKIAKNTNPDILSLAKDIINGRENHVYLMPLDDDDDVLNNNGFYWKQCKRQLREMIKVLTWAGCAIKDNNGNIKLHNDNLNTENKAELFDILSYSEYWTPDSTKNSNENKKSYQEYMDMPEIKLEEVNNTVINQFKKYYFDNIEKTIRDCKTAVEQRNQFVQEYPLSRIKDMDINEYALGTPEYRETLCYKIEFGKYKYTAMGIGGSTAAKFGIYCSSDGMMSGRSLIEKEKQNEEWENFRSQLYSALKEYENIESPFRCVDKYPLLKGMSMVLTKLLFLYYPNKFISIASRNKLLTLLDYFGYEFDSGMQAEELSYVLNKNLRKDYDFINESDPQCLGTILWNFIKDVIEEDEKDTDGVENNQVENEEMKQYTKKDFLEEVFIKKEEYDSIVNVLENQKNIILEGAPGVGKTFMAKRLAYSIIGEKNPNRMEFIQFHQSYSYEDFIEGYRPNESGFELVKGIFYNFCKRAEKDKDNKYYLIIDEINRGNLSKIFGELLMLIEKDKREEKLTLVYSQDKFSVPSNLYIIGLMNTADRSLALIDYALRRRFAFIRINPAFENEKFIDNFKKYYGEENIKVIETIKDLNKHIADDKSLGVGFKIGHSYFSGNESKSRKDIVNIINYEIKPLLEEYWYDDEDTLNNWKSILDGVFDD